jgi:hypothetical protein
MGVIVLSAIIANIAWQWMAQCGEVLWQTPWPQLTMAAVLSSTRWVVALSLAVTAAKLFAKCRLSNLSATSSCLGALPAWYGSQSGSAIFIQPAFQKRPGNKVPSLTLRRSPCAGIPLRNETRWRFVQSSQRGGWPLYT